MIPAATGTGHGARNIKQRFKLRWLHVYTARYRAVSYGTGNHKHCHDDLHAPVGRLAASTALANSSGLLDIFSQLTIEALI
jgi:hypothetical protein